MSVQVTVLNSVQLGPFVFVLFSNFVLSNKMETLSCLASSTLNSAFSNRSSAVVDSTSVTSVFMK